MGHAAGPQRGRPVLLAGLGGFVLGAGTVLLVVWVYGRQGGFGPALPPAGGPAPAQGAGSVAPRGAGITPPNGSAGTGLRGQGRRPAPIPGLPAAAPPSWNPPSAAPPSSNPPSAPSLSSGPDAATAVDLELLRGRRLLLPVQGVRAADLKDSFSDPRSGGGRVHEALDIMAARNTPVLAADDGKVAKLFLSRQGGNTIYQFDAAGNYCYYYAHLDRYADDLREGAPIRRGQVLGFVGSTGNADASAPHLHFAVFRLTPDKRWWQGTPLDPFLLFHTP